MNINDLLDRRQRTVDLYAEPSAGNRRYNYVPEAAANPQDFLDTALIFSGNPSQHKGTTYLESKVQTQRNNEGYTYHNRPSDAVKIRPTTLLDHPTSDDIYPPAPSSSSQGNDGIEDAQNSPHGVGLASPVIQT